MGTLQRANGAGNKTQTGSLWVTPEDPCWHLHHGGVGGCMQRAAFCPYQGIFGALGKLRAHPSALPCTPGQLLRRGARCGGGELGTGRTPCRWAAGPPCRRASEPPGAAGTNPRAPLLLCLLASSAAGRFRRSWPAPCWDGNFCAKPSACTGGRRSWPPALASSG